MIKRTLPGRRPRRRAIIPKLRPVGNPDWYKRFRQLTDKLSIGSAKTPR